MKSKLERSLPVINKTALPGRVFGVNERCAAAALRAQQDWTSAEEFRTQYMQFIDALSARVAPEDESSRAVDCGIRSRICVNSTCCPPALFTSATLGFLPTARAVA